MVDILLKDHGLESANEVISPIEEDCKDMDLHASGALTAFGSSGHTSIEASNLSLGFYIGLHVALSRTSVLLCTVQPGGHTSRQKRIGR